jgi:hypothetical protein
VSRLRLLLACLPLLACEPWDELAERACDASVNCRATSLDFDAGPKSESDAGTPLDAGASHDGGGLADAGAEDAGAADAGVVDAGTPDAGVVDAGLAGEHLCLSGSGCDLQNNGYVLAWKSVCRLFPMQCASNTTAVPDIEAALANATPTVDGGWKVDEVYGAAVDGVVRVPFAVPVVIDFWSGVLQLPLDGGVWAASVSGLAGSPPRATTHTASLAKGPLLAALLAQGLSSSLQILTRNTGNCPIVSGASINTGSCFTGNTVDSTVAELGSNISGTGEAGIITNPGFMALHRSNGGLRRARMLAEIFACEASPPLTPGGLGLPGEPPGLDAGSLIPARPLVDGGTDSAPRAYRAYEPQCLSCHDLLNRRALPMLDADAVGFRDDSGRPMMGSPAAADTFMAREELLVSASAGSLPHQDAMGLWKPGQPATTTTELGARMSNDVAVKRCLVKRTYAFALNLDANVSTPLTPTEFSSLLRRLPVVPDGELAALETEFQLSGYRFLDLLRAVLKSPAFINRRRGCGPCAQQTTCGAVTPRVCGVSSCSDGVLNGDETDIDCGGSCGPCAVGRCAANTDCTGGTCVAGYCAH